MAVIYLPVLGLKLNYVSKRGHRSQLHEKLWYCAHGDCFPQNKGNSGIDTKFKSVSVTDNNSLIV